MNKLALGFAAVFIICVVAVWLFVVPLDVQQVGADITVDENRTAFKLTNETYLHFGTIGRENAATRAIELEAIRDRAITATVYIDGPQWLSVSENPIRLYPNETKTVVFTADPANDTAYGNYTWDITIVYRRR